MTLKEQLRPHAQYWDCYNDEPLEYDHTNKLVKIADEFAIGFAEWILINNFEMRDDNHENWWGKLNEEKDYSSKELLEIYKKENNL